MVMDGISAVTHAAQAIETIKKLRGALKKIENTEILLWVSDLQNDILDLKGEVIDLRGHNQQLKIEKMELESKLNNRENFIYEDNFYWLMKEDATREGPYCPTCYDGKGKTCRLPTEDTDGGYYCRVCKEHHRLADHYGKEQPRRVKKTHSRFK